jgi:hypothetical protein
MKKCFLLLLLFFNLTLSAKDAFETHCQSCHFASNQLSVFMHKYTLKYSSKKRIKAAIIAYLKDPKEENSLMPLGFINRFGIKEPTTLNDKALEEAVEAYYQRYNLKDRIQ